MTFRKAHWTEAFTPREQAIIEASKVITLQHSQARLPGNNLMALINKLAQTLDLMGVDALEVRDAQEPGPNNTVLGEEVTWRQALNQTEISLVIACITYAGMLGAAGLVGHNLMLVAARMINTMDYKKATKADVAESAS